ncbi:Lnpb protein [Gryllus bimaculatus]|nr:Lnpb protein [Gryllus bimaculatus]
MGVILSRFRKKKSTLEILEGLEKDIKSIEEYGQTTERQHKAIVGRLVLFSVGLYVLMAALFYFFFFPASMYDQIQYVIPLLLFPLIIVFVKRLVSWWYRRKISRNQVKLGDMKKQKKELLEEVMDKETYKVARQILEKFAPEQLRKPSAATTSSVLARAGLEPGKFSNQLALSQRSVVQSTQTATSGTELRRRPVGPQLISSSDRLPPPRPLGSAPGSPRVSSSGILPTGQMMTRAGMSPSPMRLTRPILPRERTVMDRLVEYLVGDGINQRYALICRNCCSHNGMALKEEFEYLAFRCCYCFHWNPARKQRLQAPRLDALPSSGNTTTSSSPAESNTEEEEDSSPKHKTPVPLDGNEKENKSELHERKASSSSSDGIIPANAESAESPSSTEAEFESLVPDSTATIPSVGNDSARYVHVYFCLLTVKEIYFF